MVAQKFREIGTDITLAAACKPDVENLLEGGVG